MCGIGALIGGAANATAQRIVGMTRLVAHRGPDDEGYLALCGGGLEPRTFSVAGEPIGDARVLLGHRRLSIVDLSPAGHQPMAGADGLAWVTYNGEVYNHVELRRELEALGHAFVSHSDTEVMLAAYRQWGIACLERFNGMFAFVLVDRARRRAYAVRDRFGVKPLYFWRAPDGALAFASEIKQFTALEGWRARLNRQRAYDFLAWGAFDHTEETLFDGVRQLRGGELLEIDLAAPANPAVRRWYGVEARAFRGTRQDAAEEFRALLTDSVRLRLRADVPVGSCLSGGLDSSAIVCTAAELLRSTGGNRLQKTFSAVSDSPRLDERRYAEEVVRVAQVEPHTTKPGPEAFFPQLDHLLWHHDEPFATSSIYAQWEVFRLAAAAGVKVMLDGQGADESLGGYPSFHGARLAGLFRGLRWAKLAGEISALKRVHGMPATAALRGMAAGLLPGTVLSVARTLGGEEAPDWLDVRKLGAAPVHPYAGVAPAPRRSMLAFARFQLLRSSLPALLHWEDRDSMAHSIEARVPFLDYRLIELALGLPDEYRIDGGVTKIVLREAMRGVLPEKVRLRTDKLGFQMDDEGWLRRDPQAYRAALRASIEAAAGIIRPAAEQVLEATIEGRRPFSFRAWGLIAFGAWIRRFSVAF